MKNEGFSIPAKFIITSVFLVIALHYAQDLIIPILYGGFLATLFMPLATFLERKKFPRILSICTCLLTMVIGVAIILFSLYVELATLSKDLPLFEKKAEEKLGQVQIFFEKMSGVTVAEQTTWLEKNYAKSLTTGTEVVKDLLLSITHGVELFIFVIIYFFFFLLLRERFQLFLYKLFEEEHHPGLKSVLDRTQFITRKYLGGQLKVMGIIAVLNTIGFMIIGVKQAIFWGFLRGLLNIIPYIGPFIGAIFPALSAITYKNEIWAPIAVIAVVAITQIIQDNYLIPKFIGSNIKINPLVTIMSILVGGMIWGVNGMILFLPLAGIVKIVCDNVGWLKPYGYLMGDDDSHLSDKEIENSETSEK